MIPLELVLSDVVADCQFIKVTLYEAQSLPIEALPLLHRFSSNPKRETKSHHNQSGGEEETQAVLDASHEAPDMRRSQRGVQGEPHPDDREKPTGPDDRGPVTSSILASFNLNFNHCNTGSQRTLLQNLTSHDPRIRQVGSQCIQKFRCMSTWIVLIQAVQAAGLIS